MVAERSVNLRKFIEI